MDIPNLWRSFYGDESPISYLLREQMPNQWFRVHSLPQSKRYAENEGEAREIMRRHNSVASEVLGENAPCIIFFPGYVEHVDPNLFAEFDWQFFNQYRTEELQLTMFAAQTQWQSQQFDAILRRVARR